MADHAQPVVSVVIPVHNAGAFLRSTVDSVLQQSFQDWEIILVDDCSKDNSLEIEREYAERDDRIRILCNESNCGVAETRNRGIRESRGRYIALLDSDDLWRSCKLEKQLSLARDSDAQLVYCSYGMIDSEGKHICEDFIVPTETNMKQMLVRSVISCSTALISADLLKEHPFRPDYYHEDYVLWLELLQAGCRTVGCREVLADYRISRGSRSGNKRKSAVERWRVYRQYLHMPLLPSVKSWLSYVFNGLRKYKIDAKAR